MEKWERRRGVECSDYAEGLLEKSVGGRPLRFTATGCRGAGCVESTYQGRWTPVIRNRQLSNLIAELKLAPCTQYHHGDRFILCVCFQMALIITKLGCEEICYLNWREETKATYI